MRSGDGLVVRVRPVLARLDLAQALALCDLALDFGSGALELTNRANLQIRGVSDDGHPALIAQLDRLGLLDADPMLEKRRNVLISPFWEEGDLTCRLARSLLSALPELPDLPAKFGFAVDTGVAPMLTRDPADIRLERAEDGLILRADGAEQGRLIAVADAIPALLEMARWFNAHRSEDRRRMRTVLPASPLPAEWQTHAPRPPLPKPQAGMSAHGPLLGAPFGQIDAQALRAALTDAQAKALRVTPWRLFLLEGGGAVISDKFATQSSDPLLRVDACTGAPLCPQASVETRDLARDLAPLAQGTLHISGCSKGCARARPADLTLVGRNGTFDLVRQGCAWDDPRQTGLMPHEIPAALGKS
jgi:precorrin-3B synthase